jgi:ubiquinone/menaquinone biosynthesis C-methylase UbiE
MHGTKESVLAHHRVAAEVWGQGGAAYDLISFGLSDALAHAAQRLNPKPGHCVLDIATGTGWTARNVARLGARVTATDIAAPLLDAARDLCGPLADRIAFQQADAESLPFADAQFDGVISTFGVIFAQHQEKAAAEMARVCRKGGRLVLAVWAPHGAVEDFFGVVGPHSDAPPPAVSPLAWGEPDHARRLLGEWFELKFEPGINDAYYETPEDAWQHYSHGFGPIRSLADRLPTDRLAALKRDVDAYHARYASEAGLHIKREYLVVIGRRYLSSPA